MSAKKEGRGKVEEKGLKVFSPARCFISQPLIRKLYVGDIIVFEFPTYKLLLALFQ
jgi:hypothetical protein